MQFCLEKFSTRQIRMSHGSWFIYKKYFYFIFQTDSSNSFSISSVSHWSTFLFFLSLCGPCLLKKKKTRGACLFNFSTHPFYPIANYRRKKSSQGNNVQYMIRRNKGAYLTNCFACIFVIEAFWCYPPIKSVHYFYLHFSLFCSQHIIEMAFSMCDWHERNLFTICIYTWIRSEGGWKMIALLCNENWTRKKREQFVFDKRSAKFECGFTHTQTTNSIRHSVAFYKSNEDYSTNNNWYSVAQYESSSLSLLMSFAINSC